MPPRCFGDKHSFYSLPQMLSTWVSGFNDDVRRTRRFFTPFDSWFRIENVLTFLNLLSSLLSDGGKNLDTICKYEGVLSDDLGRSFIEREDVYVPRKDPCGTSENKMNFEDWDDANLSRWRMFNRYLRQQKYSEVLSNPFLWHNFPDEQCVIWAFSFSRLVVNASCM